MCITFWDYVRHKLADISIPQRRDNIPPLSTQASMCYIINSSAEKLSGLQVRLRHIDKANWLLRCLQTGPNLMPIRCRKKNRNT